MAAGQTDQPRVLAVHLDNDINPVTQEFVDHAIDRAENDGYDAAVLVLDTPGTAPVDADQREAGHGSCARLIDRPEIDRRDACLGGAEGVGSHDSCRGDGEEEGDRTAHATQGG